MAIDDDCGYCGDYCGNYRGDCGDFVIVAINRCLVLWRLIWRFFRGTLTTAEKTLRPQ